MGSETMDSPLLAFKSPRPEPAARFSTLGNWTEARDESAPMKAPLVVSDPSLLFVEV